MQVAERRFDVNGYTLAAKEWNTGGSITVIACHGWLDNAASFDSLAPLLDDCHLVALDLPGHGLSDHKPLQATYNIWDDLLDILAVADAMDWQQFHLLGHSRGAIISVFLAAAMPDRIKTLTLLDGIIAPPVDVKNTPKQLNKFLTQHRSIAKKTLTFHRTVEDAISARCIAASMCKESARPIVERGLIKTEQGYQWRTDPRLMMASGFKMTADHNQALLKAITMPNRLFLAEQGFGKYTELASLVKQFKALNIECLSGSHHFHMEQQAEDIASNMLELFAEVE